MENYKPIDDRSVGDTAYIITWVQSSLRVGLVFGMYCIFVAGNVITEHEPENENP